jgi:lysophospholipase L1-like esterase
MRAIVAALRQQNRAAHILICGPFPAGERGSAIRQTIDAIHAQLPRIVRRYGWAGRGPLPAQPGASYLDLRPLFLNDDGTCNQENMRGDRIHITAKGQQAWMNAITPTIELFVQPR